VVCAPGFLAPRFPEWLAGFAPTWYTAVPTMHQAIVARMGERGDVARGRLRFIRSSSAALPRRTLAALERTFGVPVVEAYGMTEAAHQMASNPLPPGERKPGSVGPAAGPELAVLAEDGRPAEPGRVGEVVVRGPNVMGGYVGRPEANAAAFTGGWFRTGDQGYLDEDGYLFLTGRIKELINRGGEKISPLEIDHVLLEHPAVAEALSLAVPHPSLGEDVAAAVVPLRDARLRERDLRDLVASRLAYFKVPRRIVFVEAIPRGATGKLQRVGLAERLGVEAVAVRSDRGHRIYTSGSTGRPKGVVVEHRSIVNLVTSARHVIEPGDRVLQFANIAFDAATRQIFSTLSVGATVIMPGDALHWAVPDFMAFCRSELTAQRFVPDSFVAKAGARMFLTGDVGRRRPDGALEFLGRRDGQLKIRGYRIEAGDVEAVLRAYPGVVDAAVVGRAQQPLFSVHPPRVDGPDTIPAMAAKTLDALRGIQPEGPYLLAGFCNAGVIAYEMARQLHAEGEDVRFLGIIDGSPRHAALTWLDERLWPWARRLGVTRDSFTRMLLRLHTPAQRIQLDRAGGRRPSLLRAAAITLGWAAGAALSHGRSAAAHMARRQQHAAPAKTPDPATPEQQRNARLFAAQARAMARYLPGPYPGRITFFALGNAGSDRATRLIREWQWLSPDVDVQTIQTREVLHGRVLARDARAIGTTLAAALSRAAARHGVTRAGPPSGPGTPTTPRHQNRDT
jgi:acyl-CoA synthetase (AMP-forming)/AMP-acid ligase II/thioesterase domain-containing protein